MDIKKCKVLLAVHEVGSFTRVGEVLGYSQSGITQMMKALEQEVGFTLFIKHNHGVELTAEAKELLPSMQALINANEVVNQAIASLKGAQKGTITIGTYLSCAMHWIPQIISVFQEHYPEIHFRIVEGTEGELADWIEDRRVDIGFLSSQKGQRYTFLPILKDEVIAVLPANHPLTNQEEISLSQLEGQPFIITEYTPENDTHRILKEHGIRPNIRCTTINEFSSISMVEANLGITIVPNLFLAGQSGNFVTRPLKPKVYRKLGLAYTDEKDLSPATLAFLKYAKQYLLSK